MAYWHPRDELYFLLIIFVAITAGVAVMRTAETARFVVVPFSSGAFRYACSAVRVITDAGFWLNFMIIAWINI